MPLVVISILVLHVIWDCMQLIFEPSNIICSIVQNFSMQI